LKDCGCPSECFEIKGPVLDYARGYGAYNVCVHNTEDGVPIRTIACLCRDPPPPHKRFFDGETVLDYQDYIDFDVLEAYGKFNIPLQERDVFCQQYGSYNEDPAPNDALWKEMCSHEQDTALPVLPFRGTIFNRCEKDYFPDFERLVQIKRLENTLESLGMDFENRGSGNSIR